MSEQPDKDIEQISSELDRRRKRLQDLSSARDIVYNAMDLLEHHVGDDPEMVKLRNQLGQWLLDSNCHQFNLWFGVE